MAARLTMYPLGYTCKRIKDSRRDIRLTGIRDAHFLKSEWENFQPERAVSFKYLAFRGFWMCAIIFIFIFSIVNDGMVGFYPIYLTHWSIMTQVLYSILFFIRVVIGYYFYRKNRQVHPEGGQVETDENQANSEITSSKPIIWLQGIIWFLQPICWVLPIVVTVGFWATIYKPEDYVGGSPYAFPATCMVHGANLVLAIIDVAVIAIPVHATHCVYILCYAILYAIFSGIYEAAKGQYPSSNGKMRDYIYATLNWKQTPGFAFLASFVASLIAIFLFFWLYVVYAFRLLIVSFFKENTYEEHFYDSKGHNCPHCAHGHPHDHVHDHSCGHCHDCGHSHECGHSHDCGHTVATAQPQSNENPGGQEPETPRSPIDVPTEG